MAYNPFTGQPALAGSTGSGLDQIVSVIAADRGLAGRITGRDIEGGAKAANALNDLIIEAGKATGAITAEGHLTDGSFTIDEIMAMNAWIRQNSYDAFTALHGDDEGRVETGYHLVQNDGGVACYRGQNFLNTVVDGIFHIGFEVQDGRFLNEDGNPNARVQDVADWLTQLYTDHSTTGTGLDRITDLIMADRGLDARISDADIAGGADAANGLNGLIQQAIAATGADADNEITSRDVIGIQQWIKANAYDQFVALHGDDEKDSETGFHLVQNDGASTRMFGQNFVNTVADGMYHIGFDIRSGQFLNEDGDKNARVTDVASWLDFFYSDASTTGTGLDWITDSIKLDRGLSRDTRAADINEGARAADSLNHMILDGLNAVGALGPEDDMISVEDVLAVNTWIQADPYRWQDFVELHGDDEGGEETGYHLVQNDGGTLTYRGDNLINTVADGIYHIGFDVCDERFLNEDGDPNADVADVATWLNSFVLGRSVMFGRDADGDKLVGKNDSDTIFGRGGDDCLYGNDGNDTLDGGAGCDRLDGGTGDDELIGAAGDDCLYGGSGGDMLLGDEGNDTLSGATGADELWGGLGDDRLDGGDDDDLLFGEGGNDSLKGGNGNDQLDGFVGDDVLGGGNGDDVLTGGLGRDTLTGNAGADQFVFDVVAGAANADRVTDFQVGVDKIVLVKAGLDPTELVFGEADSLAGMFVSAKKGAVALDADDHIIYDRASGGLFYDADGVGGTTQELIATLGRNLNLTVDDFVLV